MQRDLMHVTFLIPTIDRIGGAERQLLLLAAGIAERGWRVTLISLYGNGGIAAEQFSAANVSFFSLGMNSGLRDPRGWSTLRRFIASVKPDIVHAHLAQAALMARSIRMMTPIRVLVDTIHSPAVGSTARQRGYRLTSRIPDCVAAVGRTAARSWLDAGIVDKETIAIIPNGIDTKLWAPREHSRLPSIEDANQEKIFRWIAVGRLEQVKDYATMLRAFAVLPASGRLTICGSGPLETDLRSLAAHLGIQDRVAFLGFQSNIARIMHTHDAFVLSSKWEGLPLTLLEASACGLPAVFTELDGCREVLPDSHLPVAPPGDPEALAAAMSALMNMEQSARKELGERARQLVVSRFDLHSVLERHEELYRHLIANNARPSRSRQHATLSLQSLTS